MGNLNASNLDKEWRADQVNNDNDINRISSLTLLNERGENFKMIGTASAHNNYNYNNYFSFPRFSLLTSIDLVILNFKEADDKEFLFSILTAHGYECISDYKIEDDLYGMIRTYRSGFDGSHIQILHYPNKRCPYLPSFRWRIHTPDIETVMLLDSIFKFHEIVPVLSATEVTFDFYTGEVWLLFHFLKFHLYHRHRRSQPVRQYESTCYSNDLRASSSGIKIYLKPEERPFRFVRLELTLKRAVLKKLNLEFPLSNIDQLDLSKHFIFKSLKEEGLKEHLLWKQRESIQKAEQKRKGFGGVISRQIESWLDVCISDKSLMEKVDALKKKARMSNYSRFFKPHNEFTAEFMAQVARQQFIRSRAEREKENIFIAHRYKLT
jgi:hypothetical protein